MEVLGDARTSLRAFLLQAATTCVDERDRKGLETAVRNVRCPELRRLLHESIVYHYYKAAPPYPKTPWSTVRSFQLSEVIALVIERLLTRRRVDPSDSNLLTLGYREVAPGSHGHRVAATNSVMCYFPNTLVATLKTATWESLHALIGDDLLVHLLLNYCVFVKVSQPDGSYVQIAGTSLRWMKRPIVEPAPSTDTQLPNGKKRKNGGDQAQGEPPGVRLSTISINQVMYARHFQKRKIFAKSKLAIAADCGDQNAISRGRASKLICSIFPDAKYEKRLPKRLVNLVPIIQEMLQRVQATDIDALISKVLPTPTELHSFMRNHRTVREVITSIREGSSTSTQDTPASFAGGKGKQIHAVICRVAEEGYLSQPESPNSFDNRKRKRRDNAVEALSSNSMAATGHNKTVKRVRFEQKDFNLDSESEPQLGVSQLAQLQRHREEIAALLQITVPKKKVRRVARKVLSAIVPKSLFGTASADCRSHDTNWAKVKEFVDRLITSRKYDILCPDRIASRFRVKDIKWMDASGKSTCPPNELQTRQKLVGEILKWVMSDILFPVLRNCFYITECEGSANDVFYYSRPVWTTISNLALYDLTSHILRLAPPVETTLATRQLGASRLRLLPKLNGVRPLMNLSGKSLDKGTSVNRSLELVHRALLFEIDRQSSRLLGATVRNVDEIHAKLKSFFRDIQGCSCSAGAEGRKLYCVTVDVERCFDTIRPKKLLRMLKKVFAEEEYLVRKHWVCKGTYYKMERPAFPSGDLKSYIQLVHDNGKKSDAVFVDGVLYDYIAKPKILALLREHLTGNTVQADDTLFTQRQGIPQGSVLSTTLCNLYYAHFEKRVVRKRLGPDSNSQAEGTNCSHELLMRYTDDFLFVSTDREKARSFAELMHCGNEEYGCFVNPQKSRVNFPVVIVGAAGEMREIPRFDEPSHGECNESDSLGSLLPWCGLLLDPQSMQIYVNYDKLSLSVVAASIPLDDSKKMSALFVNKILSAIRQRWHRLYFDPEMLCSSTIQVNVYQMLCLAALRFMLLVDRLPAASSVSFLHGCVQKIIMKTSRGIQHTLPECRTRQRSEMDSQIWEIGLRSFSVMIAESKLRHYVLTDSTEASMRPPPSHSLWQGLINLISMDIQRRHMRQALDHVPTAPNVDIKLKLLTLNELQHDPRNAVVNRWIAAYKMVGPRRI